MSKNKVGSQKIGRDAGNGQFIPVKEAQRRPKTAIVETVKTAQPGSTGGKRK